eukprot:6214677-Pleurochrysis_carterae.AAC.1
MPPAHRWWHRDPQSDNLVDTVVVSAKQEHRTRTSTALHPQPGQPHGRQKLTETKPELARANSKHAKLT